MKPSLFTLLSLLPLALSIPSPASPPSPLPAPVPSTPSTPSANPNNIDTATTYRTNNPTTSTHLLLTGSTSPHLPVWNPTLGFPAFITSLLAALDSQIALTSASARIGVNWYFNVGERAWQWRMVLPTTPPGTGERPTWGDARAAAEVVGAEMWRFVREGAGEGEGEGEGAEYRTLEVVIGRIGVEGNEGAGRMATALVWWGHMYNGVGGEGAGEGEGEELVEGKELGAGAGTGGNVSVAAVE